MAKACEFKRSYNSARTKMIKKGILDPYNNVIDHTAFRKRHSVIRNTAKLYGVDEEFYFEEKGGTVVIPNWDAWKKLDIAIARHKEIGEDVDEDIQRRKSEGDIFDQGDSLLGIDTKDPEKLAFHVNTLNVIGKFLESVGVSPRMVSKFLSADGTVVDGALAAANFIDGTVDILDDLEQRPSAWNKLPEEAAHWWYRLLKTDSPLKKALWDSHKAALKADELYRTEYGNLVSKPADLTEEAIGQLIAEAIKRVETKNGAAEDYSFLKKFVEWINSIINKFKSTEQDPFEVAAMKILSSDMTDLMSWEEYKKINNIVNFSEQITNQSSAPLDYSLLTEIGEIRYTTIFDEEIGEKQVLSFANSPYFDTKVELDDWVHKHYGKRHDLEQEKILQEVRDNEAFFERLLNQTFRKRTRFLPKTLRKYFNIVDSSRLNRFKEWNIEDKTQEITKKLSENEKEQLILTNNYTNITPTLRVLPTILSKYKKNPISLSQPIRIDGAKKQELAILDGVKRMIEEENPNLKSISAEEFVNEVHTWLETNYLLGFANETGRQGEIINAYPHYNIPNIFVHYDKNKNISAEELDAYRNLTEEQVRNLSYEERQRYLDIAGIGNRRYDVYHNKISIRFNDQSHLSKNVRLAHFEKRDDDKVGIIPSAWGNLTYFYTGNSEFKDAVLLHEIQNDNIEFLRKVAKEEVNLDNSLANYLQNLYLTLAQNLRQIESGNKRVEIISENPNLIMYSHNDLHDRLRSIAPNAYQNVRQAFDIFKEQLSEYLELRKEKIDILPKNMDLLQKKIDDQYAIKRAVQSLKKRGGLKSLLTKEELAILKAGLIATNNIGEVEQPGEYHPDENQYEPGGYGEMSYKQKKSSFRAYGPHSSLEVYNIEQKLNKKLQEIYGPIFPKFEFDAPRKPRTRTEIRQGRDFSEKLNESEKYLLLNTENKIIEKASKTIENAKLKYISLRNEKKQIDFNISLKKIKFEQFETLIENFNYNRKLLKETIKRQAEKDMQSFQGEVEEGRKDILSSNQVTIYEDLKEKAEQKAEEISKKFKVSRKKLKDTLEVEMNYFTPLVHHLIQKHIKNYGKDFPMYFSGFNLTYLTQTSYQSALLYAGKEEVKYTKEEADKIKKEIAVEIGLVDKNVSTKEALKALRDYKNYSDKNLDEVVRAILVKTNNRPLETGAIYNAMSQIKGIKLIWQDKIEGIKSSQDRLSTGTGGYKVDLSNYNYNVPILYGLDTTAPIKQEKVEPSTKNESEALENKLVTFLSNYGISVEFVDSMKARGFDSVAIFDTAKKLVLVSKGKMDATTLPEEAAHAAIELLGDNNPLVKRLMDLIEGTEVYQRVYDEYSTRPDYMVEGKPNITKIKKEAIGKALGESILKGKPIEKSVESTLKRLWDKVKSVFKKVDENKMNTEFNDIINTIKVDILNNTLKGNIANLEGKNEIYSQATNTKTDKERQRAELSIEALKTRLKQLKSKQDDTVENARVNISNTIDKIQLAIDDNESIVGVHEFVKLVDTTVLELKKIVNDAKKAEAAGKNAKFGATFLKDTFEFLDLYEKSVASINGLFQESPSLMERAPALKAQINELVINFSDIREFLNMKMEDTTTSIINQNSPNGELAKEVFSDAKKDTNFFTTYLGLAKNASAEIIKLVDNMIRKAVQTANRNTTVVGRKLVQMQIDLEKSGFKDFSLFFEHENDGKGGKRGNKTGYITRRYNYHQYNLVKEKYKQAIAEELGYENYNSIPHYALGQNEKAIKRKGWDKFHKDHSQPYKGGYTPNNTYINPNFEKIKDLPYYNELLRIKRESLSKLPIKLQTKQNEYKLPQIRKTTLNRLKSRDQNIFKNIGQMAYESVSVTKDDTEFGMADRDVVFDPITKKEIKFLPIHFNHMLDDMSNLSDDLTGMFTSYYHMAESYNQKSQIKADIWLIEEAVRKQKIVDTEGGEIKGEGESNTHKMLTNIVDHYFFGKQATNLKSKGNFKFLGKEFNAIKIADQFIAYVRRNNLLLSSFTHMSNYLVGAAYSKVESISGKYVNTESMIFAELEIDKNSVHMMSEIGKRNKSNKVSLLLERNGVIHEIHSSFKNLDTKNRFARAFAKSGLFGTYEFTDTRIKGKLMLGVYDNFRLVNGKFVNFSDFKADNKNLKGKQLKQEWAKYKEKTLYQAFNSGKYGLEIKPEYKQFVTNDLENRVNSIINQITDEVDGTLSEMDRTELHRNVIGRAVLTHRNWLVVGAAARWKKKGYNYTTGLEEEGYHRTMLNAMMEMFTNKNETFDSIGDRFKFLLLQSDNMSDMEKANIKKAYADFAFLFLAILASSILTGIADDEPDDFLAQYAGYMSERVRLEASAITPLGITELTGILSSPAAGVNQMTSLIEGFKMLNPFWRTEDGHWYGNKKITQGGYQGMTKWQQLLIKRSILKPLYEFGNTEVVKSKLRYLEQIGA